MKKYITAIVSIFALNLSVATASEETSSPFEECSQQLKKAGWVIVQAFNENKTGIIEPEQKQGIIKSILYAYHTDIVPEFSVYIALNGEIDPKIQGILRKRNICAWGEHKDAYDSEAKNNPENLKEFLGVFIKKEMIPQSVSDYILGQMNEVFKNDAHQK